MQDIKQFIADNENMEVEVSPGVSYNQRDVINESYRLYNSKYQESLDSSGLEKIFYNIIWVIYRTIIMASDIDLKDMQMRSLNGKMIPVLQLLKMAVRSHLNKTKFGMFIDDAMQQMVWFGSSVSKRVNGSVEIVDLRNYITQPHIKDPQNRSHAESIFYTYDQMMVFKEDFKDNWKEIEDLWEQMQEKGENLFKIVEFWTWEEIYKKVHKVCKKHLDREDYKPDDYRGTEDWSPYLLLDTFITPYKRKRKSKKDIKKLGEMEEVFPYEQVDFFDCPGRWIGMGCGELLAGVEEHYNEQYNLKRKKDILDLRGIFVHKYTNSSNSLTQNFLDNLETGDVLSMDVGEDIQRLVIDTKTNEFITTVDKLYELARLIMGIQAVAAGEDLPSSTATEAVINKQIQQTTYDFVREQMHHFLVGLFSNGYFEDIINEITEKEIIAISGDPKELQELDKMFVDNLVNAEFARIKDETGMYPGEEEYKALKDKLMSDHKAHGDMRFPELKKELIKGLEYFIEFYVTNEGFDKNIKVQNLTALKNDPSFTGSREAVDDEILELMDLNPARYEKSMEEKTREVEAMRERAMAEAAGVNAPQPMSQDNNQEALMEANPIL